MRKIQVKIPSCPKSSYCIAVGAGSLPKILAQIRKSLPGKELFLITDANVVKAKHLKNLLGKEKLPLFIITPAGEKSKNIKTVIKIIEEMEKKALGRDCVVIALGGGTVGDIAGFVAAIYKRGVPVIQIPTTTVSQADSSVGGKTGVDSSVSKNAFGSFKNPAAVFIDVSTLKTLDKEQFNTGLVESIKHALIADEEYLKYLQKNLKVILARKAKPLEYIAVKNCRIKASVVEADPYEKNKRRVLNYGHTIGHAVESASNYKILHGQAVAIGIIAANIIEQKLGFGGKERLAGLKKLFGKLDISLKIPKTITKRQILDIISRDKKAVKKWPRFVLLEKTGKVLCKKGQFAHKTERKIVEETINILIKQKF
ncbi:MAG: 3-dehydroquinate synthase [Planctomycetes bacterium]|nr:3-dehydroquinate synthase [Planctomycetota bacterium]MBU1519022.1 3-dehydroquinate synthase [Planctomycetota bacterium]MBU2457539.1 3-dehydroquinate synthase [Planctomycetota bacterium]